MFGKVGFGKPARSFKSRHRHRIQDDAMDFWRRLMGRDNDLTVTHSVPERGGFFKLLSDLLEAYKKRTEQWSESDNSAVLTAINNLDRKVTTMSSNIDRIEKEAADAAENVGLVRTAIEELKTISEGMKAEIVTLKEQVAQGQLDQARLDAAAAVFEKADDDMDALILPPAPPPDTEPPVEG